jgi:hypothetical protein
VVALASLARRRGPRRKLHAGAALLASFALVSLVTGGCGTSSTDVAPADAGAHDAALDARADAPQDAPLFPVDDGGGTPDAPPKAPPACAGGFGPTTTCGMANTLSWSCANATSCTYECTGSSSASGPVACTGNTPFTIDAAGESCVIHATGPGGTSSANASASCGTVVKTPMCTASFAGCGDGSTITWSCTDASTCAFSCSGSISAGGAVACAGTSPVAVGLAGETCSITANGPGGTGSTTAVATCLPPACTASFSGCGATSSVSWNCDRATSCSFDCTGAVVGSGSTTCSGTTPLDVGTVGESCTISAVGAGGTASATATACH